MRSSQVLSELLRISDVTNRHLKRRQMLDRAAEALIIAFASIAMAIILLIFVYVGREALPLLWENKEGASLTSTFAPPVVWQPVSTNPRYNVIPLMLGTLKITLIAMLIGTPLALAAALYTAEFAPVRLREWIKPAIELLAGIPSVVMGFFALIVLASWLQAQFGFDFRLNALNAGIALALAIIPIIYTVSEDALNAVPNHFPAAMPGIGAAMILGFGRAIGETMIVLMASGGAAIVSLNPLDSSRTLSATIAAELGEVVFGGGHYRVLFFIGTLLFVVTSLLNWVGDRYNRKMRVKLFGTE
jgi:phosphate transport system permease protein